MPLMRSAANGESCRSGYFYGKILTEYTGKVLKLIVKDGFFIRNLVHEFAYFQMFRMVDIALKILCGIKKGINTYMKGIAGIDIAADCGLADLGDDGF